MHFVTAASDSPAPTTHRVNVVHGWRKWLLWTLARIVNLVFSTLRFRIDKESRVALTDTSGPHTLVIWHNRIMISPELVRRFRKGRKLSALISASKDGALITSLISSMGIEACRGSTSKRSTEAVRELLRVLKNGGDIAITPDGPRGPIYSFQDGASALALLSKTPVILVCPNIERGKRFNSWDGLYMPSLFAKVEIRARRFLNEELPKDRDACGRFLREAMLALTRDLPNPPKVASAMERFAAGQAPIVTPEGE